MEIDAGEPAVAQFAARSAERDQVVEKEFPGHFCCDNDYYDFVVYSPQGIQHVNMACSGMICSPWGGNLLVVEGLCE